MLPLDAAKAAARAEMLRTRLRAQLVGRRLAGGVTAFVFALAAFVLLHVAAYNALLDELGPKWAPLAVAGGDAVLAVLALAVICSGGRTARQVQEATELRDRAVGEFRNSMTLAAALLPLLRAVRGRGGTGAVIAAIITGLMFRR
jgi:hypothetical protein